jgi:hypothetical protein
VIKVEVVVPAKFVVQLRRRHELGEFRVEADLPGVASAYARAKSNARRERCAMVLARGTRRCDRTHLVAGDRVHERRDAREESVDPPSEGGVSVGSPVASRCAVAHGMLTTRPRPRPVLGQRGNWHVTVRALSRTLNVVVLQDVEDFASGPNGWVGLRGCGFVLRCDSA